MTPCNRSRQRGFSYLWVLLLVAFMGIGLTVAAELDATMAQRERERELLAIGRQFQGAIGRYYEGQSAGAVKAYPATLEDLLQDPRAPGIRRHLRKIFVDPMTGKVKWGLVTVGGRVAGVHSLGTGTPIKQDNFPAEQANLRGKQQYAEWLFVYPPDLVLDAPPAGAVPQAGALPANPVLQEVSP
jgi:type II secretory pathway pseudopilin PulG